MFFADFNQFKTVSAVCVCSFNQSKFQQDIYNNLYFSAVEFTEFNKQRADVISRDITLCHIAVNIRNLLPCRAKEVFFIP